MPRPEPVPSNGLCSPDQSEGKVYVGQTIRGSFNRFESHVGSTNRGSRLPFHRAIRKYGAASFKVKVLETCGNQTALNEAEARWIKELGAFGPGGYNCTTGGEGFVFSDETRKRMSLAVKGKPRSECHRQALSRAMKGEKTRSMDGITDPNLSSRLESNCMIDSLG